MKNNVLTKEKYKVKGAKIIYNKDGTFNRVKIIDNVFKCNNGKSISNIMSYSVKKYIGNFAYIIESGQKVHLGKDFPKEFAFSKYSQNLPLEIKLAKGRISSGIIEIIENATNRKYSNEKKIKHIKDAKYGFYKYNTNFSFEYNGREQIYEGTILIRNDANGKKYLYDVLNIKKIGSNLLPVVSNP